MNRTLVGILILVAFVGIVVYMTAQQFSAKCEVCVSYEGRTSCQTSRAATRADAQQQATSSACSLVTGGVTDIVRCTGTPPMSVRCEE